MLQSFIGSGIVEIAPYDAAVDFYSRKFRDTGNNSAFDYKFAVNDRKLSSFRSPAGGTYASAPKIDSVTGTIAMRDFSAENLELALWGTSSSGGTTAITGEAHKIHAGAFIPTKRFINTTVAPVVKKGATTVDTDDYTVDEHGITIAAAITTVGVTDGDAITIDYTPKASISIQSLVTSAPLVSIFLRGFDAVSGEPHSLAIWKAQLGAADTVAQIGEDFGTLSLTYTAEEDATITGAGLSKYMLLQQLAA